MIRDKLKLWGHEVWRFFDPSDPTRNAAGHATVAAGFAYVNTLALSVDAGAGSAMSVYAFNEMQNLGTEIAEDKDIHWLDHFKDFVAAAPGAAVGILLALGTKALVGMF